MQLAITVPILSAASARILSVTWLYVSPVMLIVLCPSVSCTAFSETPASRLNVAYVCRKKSERSDFFRYPFGIVR